MVGISELYVTYVIVLSVCVNGFHIVFYITLMKASGRHNNVTRASLHCKSLIVVILMAGDSERETPCGTKKVRAIDKLQEGHKTLKETVSEN